MFSVNDLEPGLALMDEIGRTALTNAFIHFIRNTCDPSAYRDSLIYAGCRVTNVDETTANDELPRNRNTLDTRAHKSSLKCHLKIYSSNATIKMRRIYI